MRCYICVILFCSTNMKSTFLFILLVTVVMVTGHNQIEAEETSELAETKAEMVRMQARIKYLEDKDKARGGMLVNLLQLSNILNQLYVVKAVTQAITVKKNTRITLFYL